MTSLSEVFVVEMLHNIISIFNFAFQMNVGWLDTSQCSSSTCSRRREPLDISGKSTLGSHPLVTHHQTLERMGADTFTMAVQRLHYTTPQHMSITVLNVPANVSGLLTTAFRYGFTKMSQVQQLLDSAMHDLFPLFIFITAIIWKPLYHTTAYRTWFSVAYNCTYKAVLCCTMYIV